MTDKGVEIHLPWVEAPISNEELSLEILSEGVSWLKADFRGRWGAALRKREESRGRKNDTLEACRMLADLQRDLAYYLFLVSQNREALRELERPVTEALLGRGRDSVVSVLGENRRGYVEESLVGAISNLTFWHLIAGSRPDLVDRINFGQMVVGGIADAMYAVDVVLDFGTRTKEGRKVLRIVQLKADSGGQIVMEEIFPDELKMGYLGGSVTRKDAERMVKGARTLYSDCRCRFYAVCVPAFDSPPIGNAFGIIDPGYPGREELIAQSKEDAERTGLLPKMVKK